MNEDNLFKILRDSQKLVNKQYQVFKFFWLVLWHIGGMYLFVTLLWREFHFDQNQIVKTNVSHTELYSAKRNPPMPRSTLRKKIADYFTENDLQVLCFDLKIDYDELVGETKTMKIVALIQYCENHCRMSTLVTNCQAMRPNIRWSTI